MPIKITILLLSLTTVFLAGYVKGKKGCEQKKLIENQSEEIKVQKEQIIFRDKLIYVKKAQQNLPMPDDIEARNKLWEAISSVQ